MNEHSPLPYTDLTPNSQAGLECLTSGTQFCKKLWATHCFRIIVHPWVNTECPFVCILAYTRAPVEFKGPCNSYFKSIQGLNQRALARDIRIKLSSRWNQSWGNREKRKSVILRVCFLHVWNSAAVPPTPPWSLSYLCKWHHHPPSCSTKTLGKQ